MTEYCGQKKQLRESHVKSDNRYMTVPQLKVGGYYILYWRLFVDLEIMRCFPEDATPVVLDDAFLARCQSQPGCVYSYRRV